MTAKDDIMILFHSEIVQESIKLKHLLRNEDNARFLSVDNKKVRDIIIRSEYYDITIIPSLLLINKDGTDRIFCGFKEAQTWFLNKMNQQLFEKEDRRHSTLPLQITKEAESPPTTTSQNEETVSPPIKQTTTMTAVEYAKQLQKQRESYV
jgi:hypothetical protein